MKREAFCQWVIEDILPADRPGWGKAGVIYTSDVSAFEKAKLRLRERRPIPLWLILACWLGMETVFDDHATTSLGAVFTAIGRH